MPSLKPQLLELIRRTSSTLPDDVLAALAAARDREEPGSRAHRTFELMLENVAAAEKAVAPICQDTGTLIFYVDYGPDVSPHDLQRDVVAAVREATKRAYLRPNAVDAITGKNSGDNVGEGAPYLHLHPRKEKGLRVRLMMKGGGCENMGIQYSLPDESLSAGRDLDGVRRCIIDAVHRAQGFGCAPGTLGVGVGGDRVSSYQESKEQLFRRLDDENPIPELDELEKELEGSLQRLGIGPMGFGGGTTVLGVKIGARHRVPASFFVSVSYMCWAYRRGELLLKGNRATVNGTPIPAGVPARRAKVAAGRPAAAAKAAQTAKAAKARPASARAPAQRTAAPKALKAAGKRVAPKATKTAGKRVAPKAAKPRGAAAHLNPKKKLPVVR